jgi:GT2 family glycosyltransferase
MDVSIVIVSWRVKELVRNCLTSIFQHTHNLHFEVFVVDNNSGDGTDTMIRSQFPHVILIQNEENVGFARACNQAIKRSTGEYVLLLNPDTEIMDQAIVKTIQFMQQTSQAGIVGCAIINPDGSIQPSVRSFPNLSSHILILLKIHNFLPKLSAIRKYYRFDYPYTETHIVDQVEGAFFMIRRKVFQQIGLFDQHFYIWYEEVDFCRRAKNKGWLTYFYSGATVQHAKGQSFKQRKPFKLQLIFNRSLLYYFFKHRAKWEYVVLIILYPFSLLLAFLVQLFKIRKSHKEL